MQKYLRPQVKMGTMLVSWLCVLCIAILEKAHLKDIVWWQSSFPTQEGGSGLYIVYEGLRTQ